MTEFDAQRWLADSAADATIAERRRMYWMGSSATESSTMLGLIVDLAESHTEVSVLVTHGKWLRGIISTVGVDFVGLRLTTGASAIVALSEIGVLQPDRNNANRSRLHESDRVGASDVLMIDALSRWSHDRPRVIATLVSTPIAFSGTLVAVGLDVIAIQGDESPDQLTYSTSAALSTVVTGSG